MVLVGDFDVNRLLGLGSDALSCSNCPLTSESSATEYGGAPRALLRRVTGDSRAIRAGVRAPLATRLPAPSPKKWRFPHFPYSVYMLREAERYFPYAVRGTLPLSFRISRIWTQRQRAQNRYFPRSVLKPRTIEPVFSVVTYATPGASAAIFRIESGKFSGRG